MKSKDWHVKDFDIYSGTFDDFKRLVYYDLETFADEEEKLKEKERLESEQKDKEHMLNKNKCMNSNSLTLNHILVKIFILLTY